MCAESAAFASLLSILSLSSLLPGLPGFLESFVFVSYMFWVLCDLAKLLDFNIGSWFFDFSVFRSIEFPLHECATLGLYLLWIENCCFLWNVLGC